jgi:hypothetical protein
VPTIEKGEGIGNNPFFYRAWGRMTYSGEFTCDYV